MENIVKNIKEARKLLPHGAQKEIAVMSNTSIYTVSRVFNGKSKNIKVIRAIQSYVSDINDKSNYIHNYITSQKDL